MFNNLNESVLAPLCDDVVVHIISYLSFEEQMAIRLAFKKLNNIFNTFTIKTLEGKLEMMWKKFLRSDEMAPLLMNSNEAFSCKNLKEYREKCANLTKLIIENWEKNKLIMERNIKKIDFNKSKDLIILFNEINFRIKELKAKNYKSIIPRHNKNLDKAINYFTSNRSITTVYCVAFLLLPLSMCVMVGGITLFSFGVLPVEVGILVALLVMVFLIVAAGGVAFANTYVACDDFPEYYDNSNTRYNRMLKLSSPLTNRSIKKISKKEIEQISKLLFRFLRLLADAQKQVNKK